MSTSSSISELLRSCTPAPIPPSPWPPIDPDVHAALTTLADSREWGLYHGPNVPRLIEELSSLHHVPHIHLTASGTHAVELALRALRIEPGDEVLLSAYDFPGNFANILALGAIPRLIDTLPDSLLPDISQFSAALTPKCRAIIISHLHGALVDMPRLIDLARSHNLSIIEDACQVPLAQVSGKPAGTWGDVGVISFGGSKLLTAGRGGALIASNPQVAQRLKLLTFRGNDISPLSELQAAVLIPQLPKLAPRRSLRNSRVAFFINELGARPALTPLTLFSQQSADSQPDFYKLPFLHHPEHAAGLSRDQFSLVCRAVGIPLDPGFRSLHLTHSKKRFHSHSDLRNATLLDASILTLHHPLLLESPEHLSLIATTIHNILNQAPHIKRLLESTPAG